MSNKLIFLLVLLMLKVNIAISFNLESAVKLVVNKAKDFYKKHYDKDIKWQFAGYDQTEYPGTNKEFSDLNKAKWETYYQCLSEQEKSLENEGSIIPEAVFTVQGQHVKLDCKVCLSPLELEDVELIEWYFSFEDQNKLYPVDLSEHILISPNDKALNLFNVQPHQTGQYVCNLKNKSISPYFLTVKRDEILLNVNRSSVNNMNLSTDRIMINNEILVIDIIWSEWTKCSQCDKVGKRFKIGTCTIALLKNFQHAVEDESLDSNKSRTNTNLQTNDIEILKIFKFGIPCRSHILSDNIKRIPEIVNMPNKIYMGYCKVKCSKDEIFAVKDKNGNVLETANNSAGEYSMLQGRPMNKPPVENNLQYEQTGSQVTITCPGNLNDDIPMHWQIGSKKLIETIISKESNGRIQVLSTDEIFITQVQVSDSDVYSCWQNDELVGTITLVVEKAFKLEFQHHEMIFGILIITGTFLYVIVRVHINRKKSKANQVKL